MKLYEIVLIDVACENEERAFYEELGFNFDAQKDELPIVGIEELVFLGFDYEMAQDAKGKVQCNERLRLEERIWEISDDKIMELFRDYGKCTINGEVKTNDYS